jgi:hypothetical protein
MILTAFTTARITSMTVMLPHKISCYSQLKQLSANMGHGRVGGTFNQVLYNMIIFVFIKVLSSKVSCWIKFYTKSLRIFFNLHVDEKPHLFNRADQLNRVSL